MLSGHRGQIQPESFGQRNGRIQLSRNSTRSLQFEFSTKRQQCFKAISSPNHSN
jgi:hypothetical protein